MRLLRSGSFEEIDKIFGEPVYNVCLLYYDGCWVEAELRKKTLFTCSNSR